MSKPNLTNEVTGESSVFLVHGHDEQALEQVRDYLEKLNLVPIILKEQPKNGKTIIEKIDSKRKC